MDLFRRRQLSLLLVLLLCLSAVPLLNAQENTFAIIGDTRIGQNESVYKFFIQQLEKEKINTFVHTGDVINSAGKQKEWDRFLQITGNDKTVHIAPGNHDMGDAESLLTYTRATGKQAYYSVADNDTLFVLLNTEMPGQHSKITGDQLQWLKGELARDFKYKFVFLHRPVFPTAFGMSYSLDRYKDDRDRLHDLFVRSGVSLVVAGHEHLYNRSANDGIEYVITGGGGAPLLTLWPDHGGFFHYIIAKRTNEGYVFSVRDIEGNTKDQFVIKK